MMPNVKAVGSIHSHPGPNCKPPKADLRFFSKTGNCHIIVFYPYDKQSWKCYDNEGNIRELQVLDVKFEDFEVANLDGANFEGANLEGIDFKKANLEEADLERTDLVGTNLEGTDLVGANLEGANLKGANLKRANLKGVNELTIDQLSKVKTLYNAKLDDKLLIPLKDKHPVLFERPKL